VTVLYDDRVIEVERTLSDPNDLWVVPEDLPRVNGFELKPEGACLDELCVPVLQDRDSEMFVLRAGQAWFNVTALARKLEQAYVADHEHGVWSFGEIPVTRSSFLRSIRETTPPTPRRRWGRAQSFVPSGSWWASTRSNLVRSMPCTPMRVWTRCIR
jgi:hypothetical protein